VLAKDFTKEEYVKALECVLQDIDCYKKYAQKAAQNSPYTIQKCAAKYVEFYKSNLDEIIKIDSLKFNDSLKINFFKNLEKIGGHEILEKEKKIINTSEKKKSETGGTTTKKSSKIEESKKTLQKKEQKSESETDSKTEKKNSKTKKVG
jgi:hypothetical protein